MQIQQLTHPGSSHVITYRSLIECSQSFGYSDRMQLHHHCNGPRCGSCMSGGVYEKEVISICRDSFGELTDGADLGICVFMVLSYVPG